MIRTPLARTLPLLALAALAWACGGTDAAPDAAVEATAEIAVDAVDADGSRDTAGAEPAPDVPAEADDAEVADDVPANAEPLPDGVSTDPGAPDVDAPEPQDTVAEALPEPEPEVAEPLETVDGDGETDTEAPPLVSACVDCHTDKALLVALLPEEPTEEADHGGG